MEDNGNSFFVILKTKFMYIIRSFLSNSINGNLIILFFFFLIQFTSFYDDPSFLCTTTEVLLYCVPCSHC